MVSTDASSTKAALTDEPVAKMASPDNGEQTSNRLETDRNPDEMALAAQTIERIAAGWKDRSRAVQMLQALCGLAAGDPDRLNPDLAAENWGFRATDIGEELRRRWPKIPGVNSWADNPDTAKAKMNEHWPKLEDIWERQKPTIEDGLRAEGLPVEIALYRFSFARPAENPRRYWAGWQFRISRGWLHRDLQEFQDLFLLGCWEAILIEFSAIDRDAIARDLR
ncbi:MAG: hypothetical protein K9L32_06735 [Chromatiaceae bacterium]|nr:hypothetical protein [Chromatiaceae bacterium]